MVLMEAQICLSWAVWDSTSATFSGYIMGKRLSMGMNKEDQDREEEMGWVNFPCLGCYSPWKTSGQRIKEENERVIISILSVQIRFN